MAKEKVKLLSGVFASVFAHTGHITKEEAKSIRKQIAGYATLPGESGLKTIALLPRF